MFSTFPDAWPGAGLLLLRAAAGAALIVQGSAYLGNRYDRELPFLSIALLTTAVGALLLIGCLTRFAAVVAAVASVGSIFSWLPGLNVGLFETRMTATLAAAIAAAVFCLARVLLLPYFVQRAAHLQDARCYSRSHARWEKRGLEMCREMCCLRGRSVQGSRMNRIARGCGWKLDVSVRRFGR